jgi:hypothetical protein
MTINLQNEVKVLGLAYSRLQVPMEMASRLRPGVMQNLASLQRFSDRSPRR